MAGSQLNRLDAVHQQIEVLKRATAEIMTCTDIGEVRKFADMASAVASMAKRVRAGIETYNAAIGSLCWARRREGQLIDDMKEAGLVQRGGHNSRANSHDGSSLMILKDVGINANESSRAQAMAAVPEAIFAGLIQKAADSLRELTTQELVNIGRGYQRAARKEQELDERTGNAERPVLGNGCWAVQNMDCQSAFADMGVYPEMERARLIFADPPYNIGIRYGDHYDDDRAPWEYEEWFTDVLKGCYKALTEDGSLWLLVNHEWGHMFCIRAKQVGFHLRQWLTWYESFGVNTTRMFNRCSRPLLWLVKNPGKFVFNDQSREIRRESDRLAIYGDARANPEGKLWDDVWGINPAIPRVVGTSRERMPGFPTQLPLALLRPIVDCASEPGDLVIDPFSGSGTTGAACIELRRRFIGFELSEEFADLSRRRLVVHEQKYTNGNES